MERFVRFTAPSGKIDFAVKLFFFVVICGWFNHLRDILTSDIGDRHSFLKNLGDAGFTALPMCTFALMLIGHLNSLQKRLYSQANRDLLTDLPNRRWFMDNTPHWISAGQALLVIDIDHFKRINDAFGHDVGDNCLQQMAAHLNGALVPTDYRARIGGEEFAVFIPDADDAHLRTVANAISAGFQFDLGDGRNRSITASVGVASDPDGQSREQAFRMADEAVYRAKAQGRACSVIYPKGKDDTFDIPQTAAE